MGSPPLGLPALVERRIENRVMGTETHTDRRSLETFGLNGSGSRQSSRGHVRGRIRCSTQDEEARVASDLGELNLERYACSNEH